MSEIELAQIAMQVGFADVVKRASDPALEDREVVFDRVVVPKLGADIFFGTVVDGAVPCELTSYGGLDRGLIGHDVAGLVDLLGDQRL